VRTWYDQHGEGEPLVLLHPGWADARAWGPNLDALAAHFHVFTPERRGHGRSPDVEGPITYELMAQDTVASPSGSSGDRRSRAATLSYHRTAPSTPRW
jgi:pimeloyl-ACP methyl ester carboxylesterase